MRLIDAEMCRYGFLERQALFDRNDFAQALGVIDRQPTIELPQWIPVTELLPKNDDWLVVTVLDESGDTPYRYTDFGWYLRAADCWIVGSEQRNDVIAWMPLPEPWKGEDDER